MVVRSNLRKSGPFNGKIKKIKSALKNKIGIETTVKPKNTYGKTQSKRINKSRAYIPIIMWKRSMYAMWESRLAFFDVIFHVPPRRLFYRTCEGVF
jgi:hypothetical protein